MKEKIRAIILYVIVVVLGVGSFIYVYAETEEVEKKRVELNLELLRIEAEIDQEKVVLQDKQREKVSLERDVAILNSNIRKSQLGIKARNLAINDLVDDIDDKEVVIDILNEKTERQKKSLSQLMRKTNEVDSASLVEIILGNQNISDFFMDLDSFDSIKQSLDLSFKEIRPC